MPELEVAEGRIVGRATGGDLDDLTPAQVRTLLNVEDGADVTDAANVDAAGAVMEGDTAGGVLAGTYPNPSFASDMATQSELDAHVNDTTAAHAASAISADSTTLVGTGTDVQAVLEELDNGIADHLADSSAAHAASAISADSSTLVGTGTDVQAVLEELDNGIADHLADSSVAHAASAISFTPNGSIAATDVQAAIQEVRDEAGGSGGALDDLTDVTITAAATGDLLRYNGSAWVDYADSNYQPADTDLAAIAALTPANDDILQRKSDAWTNRTMTQLIADLAALDSTFILRSFVAAKGDLVAASADNTPAILTVGTNGYRLVAASGEATGLKWEAEKHVVSIQVTDPNGAVLTTGDGKAYFRVPATLNGMNLVAVAAAVTTVSSSGTPTVQIHNLTDTVDMLSTPITIDADEKDSKDATAAAVINTSNDDVATGDQLRIDVDVAGTGAKGLIVEMTFQLP